MTRSMLPAVLGALLCGGLAAELPAQDVRADFDSLYGPEAREVAATRTRKDDVAFARKLLDAAAKVASAPALQVSLCEKAYEFGVKGPAGYATAIEAMRLLTRVAPDRRDAADEKLVTVYELRYRGKVLTRSVREGGKLVLP